jgi:hypothetical protein
MRLLLMSAALATAGCTSVLWPQPLHELKRPIRPGEWYWCMTPAGETTGLTTQGGPDYIGATCAAPNRFVQVWVCRDGEMPVDDEYVLRANRRPESEVREMLAARVRLSRDNSLVGDRYQGRTFCAPMPPS